MNYQDKILQCRDCGEEFLFSVGEQEFFAAKGYVNEPRRCPGCRAAYRARQASMNADLSGRPARTMHPATCAQCGTSTLVPFLPRLDKPVYCSTCFDQVRAAR